MNSTTTAARLMAKLQQQPRDRMSDGRSAWHELQRAAHGSSSLVGKKLPPPVADRIARQLHDILERARPALHAAGVSMTQLARTAFGESEASSKNIARLCLPPGSDPVRRGIRRNALQFRQLISAIATHTGLNEEVIADEALVGTPLHPACAATPEFDELDFLSVALGQIVNQIDREFDLFSTFQRTAAARLAGLQTGSKLCWPQYDLRAPTSEAEREGYNADWERATDPTQVWWHDDDQFGLTNEYHWQPWGFGSGVLQDDDFFYVPHVLLGDIELWNLPSPDVDRGAYELALSRELATYRALNRNRLWPTDDFDETTRQPVGQTVPRSGSDPVRHGALPYYWWIVIYPDPRGRR